MRQFFKFTFASMLGFMLAGVLLFFILMGIIAGLATSSQKEVSISQNSILHLDFKAPIIDRAQNDPFANFDPISFSNPQSLGVNDYLELLAAAAEDDNISGIFLDLSSIQADGVIRSSIREALIDFKSSGKFIYAFAEGYTQSTYMMASVADSIFMVPTGDMLFNGLSSTPTFIKNMLEKLDVEVKLFRVGKYKSAGETFIREDLSAENRYQISSFLNSLNDQMLADLSATLDLSVDSLRDIANTLRIRKGADAVALGMIHRLCFRDEVLALLVAETDVASLKKLALVSAGDYHSARPKQTDFSEKKRIAVIYATGEINQGEGDEQSIGSDRIAAAIRSARLDAEVKAIVLRINSPGGSALASDIIWRETVLAKAEKPLVVSMGNLAASGGYYIAAAADSIFAAPNTLTGSIGVFGLIPNLQGFFENKIGITFDRVNTGPYADIVSGLRPMTSDEEQIVQGMIDRIYDDFTQVVADGRHLPKDSVHALAQGRVYTGTQALAVGLVDALGDLNDAIDCAARLAELDTYRLKELPEQKDKFELLIRNLMNARTTAVERELGPMYKHYKQAKQLLEGDRFQTRMEFEHPL